MDEQQFVLRLPPMLAQRMRTALQSKATLKQMEDNGESIPSFRIKFLDKRHAILDADGTHYPATLLDLPTICETQKTVDKSTFYKSADVHQVLVVRMPDEPAPTVYQLEDGLTPASKGARKRLHVSDPPYSHDQVRNVEDHMRYVLENKVAFVQKQATENSDPDMDHEQAEELELEEDGVPHTNNNYNNHYPELNANKKKKRHDSARDQGKAAEKNDFNLASPLAPTDELTNNNDNVDDNDVKDDTMDDFADLLAESMLDNDLPGDGVDKANEGKGKVGDGTEKLVDDNPAVHKDAKHQLTATTTTTNTNTNIANPIPTPANLEENTTAPKIPSKTANSNKKEPHNATATNSGGQAQSRRELQQPEIDSEPSGRAAAIKMFEIQKVQKQLQEIEKQVRDLEDQIKKNPNPIMKKRFQARLDEAKDVFSKKQAELEELRSKI